MTLRRPTAMQQELTQLASAKTLTPEELQRAFRHLYEEYYVLRQIAEPLAEAFDDFKDIQSVLNSVRTRIQALARQAQATDQRVEELEACEQATATALHAYVEERQALPWWKRWRH